MQRGPFRGRRAVLAFNFKAGTKKGESYQTDLHFEKLTKPKLLVEIVFECQCLTWVHNESLWWTAHCGNSNCFSLWNRKKHSGYKKIKSN